MIPLLESVVTSKGRRVLIHAPPQVGKSFIVSQRLISYALGILPELRVRLACYNITKASQFGRVITSLMSDDSYKAQFGGQSALSGVVSGEQFYTPARARLRDAQPSFLALGLESGFTGQGADLLIMDDPYASASHAQSEAVNESLWRFWTQTAKPRLNEDTNVIFMYHRYHENDLAGKLLASGEFEHVRFPAEGDENEDGSDPTKREIGEMLSPLISRVKLDDLKDNLPQVYLGQFQGVPRAPEGAFFHREWLKTGEAPALDRVVRFWDLATKADKTGDFTAGALVGIGPDHTVWLLDMVRFRAEWPDACDMIARITEQDSILYKEKGANYQVGVEKVAWQRPMIQDLFTKGIFGRVPMTATPARGDKKERASGWAARARYDRFRMVKGPWNEQFVEEAIMFDGFGLTHDDQIDGISGAYELLWALRGGMVQVEALPKAGTHEHYIKQAEANASGYDWGDD